MSVPGDSELDFSTLQSTKQGSEAGERHPTLVGLQAEVTRYQVQSQVVGHDDEVAPRVGRFMVQRVLGVGGMGVVYGAYDRELARPVAIKMLEARLSHDPLHEAQVVREAQALARLSAPHVVQVYEIGRHEGHVFIVLELVEGENLRRWLNSASRTPAELIRVYRAAARGLVSAHRSGLVHRDFKPDNVLIAKDGIAKVADFGLVRHGIRPESSVPTEPTPGGQPESVLSTATGFGDPMAGAGTPRYMSPEQRSGCACGPASDQYSFCVALLESWLANVGTRAGDDQSFELTSALVDPRVPARLRTIIRRGLESKPEDRWPDMVTVERQLLRAFPEEIRQRRTYGLVAGGVVAAATAWLLVARAGDGVDPMAERCSETADAFVTLDLAARPGQLRARADHESNPRLRERVELIESEVEQFASRWQAHHLDVCGSGALDRVAPDARAADLMCLNAAGTAVDTALSAMSQAAVEPSVDVVARAQDALNRCVETGRGEFALASSNGDLSGPALALVRGRVAGWAGDWALAQTELTKAEKAAQGHDELAAIAVESLRLRGHFKMRAGEAKSAKEPLTQALSLARRHRLGNARLRCMVDLLRLESRHLGRFERAETHALYAGDLASDPGTLPLERARFHLELGAFQNARARFDAADLSLSTAIEGFESEAGAPREIARALWHRGEVRMNLRDYGRARHDLERAQELLARRFGPRHPDQVRLLIRLATLNRYSSEVENALLIARSALRLAEEVLPPLHADLIEARTVYATALAHLEGAELGLIEAEKALAEVRRVANPGLPLFATVINRVAVLLARLGRDDEALRLHEEARMRIESELTGAHYLRLFPLLNSAPILARQGRHDEALARLDRALANERALYGPSYKSLADVLLFQYDIAKEAKGEAEAQAYADKAVKILLDGYEKAVVEHGYDHVNASSEAGSAITAMVRHGQRKQAEALEARRLAELVEHAPESSDLAFWRCRHVNNLAAAGRPAAALKYLDGHWDSITRGLGPGHQFHDWPYALRALSLHHLGRVREARVALRQMVDKFGGPGGYMKSSWAKKRVQYLAREGLDVELRSLGLGALIDAGTVR